RIQQILRYCGSRACIIDPTVRYKKESISQDDEITAEKKIIYKKCKEKYSNFGDKHCSVIGFWFGARGTTANSVLQFFDLFNLNKSLLNKICINVLADTINIIHR